MKTRRLLYPLFAVLALLAAGPSWSRPEAELTREVAPPVDQLVAEALGRAPSIAALRARLAAAREMVAAAGALPDPMVEVMLQDMGFPRWTVGTEEMSMIGPEVRQDLPYPGKRKARRQVAEAETEVWAGELEQLRRHVTSEVRTLYARIYAFDQERQYLSAAHELLDMLAATAASRYSTGQTDQEAVLKAQLEVSRLGERLDDLDADRAVTLAALNRLLNQPGGAPLGVVKMLPAAESPAGSWEELAVQGSPEVAIKQAAVAAADRQVLVARLDLKPDLTTGAAVGLRGGFDPAVTLRFGVAWPLWRKQKQEPLLRAAEHELAMAQAELRDAQATAQAEAAKLFAEWQRAERQIVRYQQAIVPQSSAAIDAARASYLAGRGDFLTVVDDFNRWLDARVELARREADRFATWAEFEALIASPPGEQAPKEK